MHIKLKFVLIINWYQEVVKSKKKRRALSFIVHTAKMYQSACDIINFKFIIFLNTFFLILNLNTLQKLESLLKNDHCG